MSANSGARNLHPSVYKHIKRKEEKKDCVSKEIVSAIGTTPYNHVRSLLEEINTHSINEQTSTIIIIIQERKGYLAKEYCIFISSGEKGVSIRP
jgi:hypothetical protein